MTSSLDSEFVVAIDLASKFSAVSVQDFGGRVVLEFDSSNRSTFTFVYQVQEAVKKYQPKIVIVEDVPYGISSQAMIKPVLRVQGILIHALAQIGMLDRILFVNPSSWQKTHPGVSRGPAADRVTAARVAAEKLGYFPPNLVQNHIDSLPEGAKLLKKHTAPLEKIMTDYIDAFLIARWAISYGSIEELSDLSGVQPIYI